MKLTKAQQWLVDQIGDDELRVIFTGIGLGELVKAGGAA